MRDAAETPPVFSYQDLPRLMSMMAGDEKHDDSATSTLDVLWVLYDRILRVFPDRPDDPDRDRFLLSKGHGPTAFYAVLAAKQFISVEELSSYGQAGSSLGFHPDRSLISGVEVSSGSLGHGLPLATGIALALRAQQRTRPRVFCLIGDGELDEGSNHEAIAFAGSVNLGGLHVVVIDNDSSTHGWSGGIATRFDRESWSTAVVDGRDHADLERALTAPHPDRPHAVVAMMKPKE
ncbi:thiamine pyrophosphate-dependent enzyme [Streptomyces sp. NPDC056987]|uniref:thiamine pyrophosphate-dependent enzyme n=1 Tax=Streptomyces sp. NPDC056987 TaxID=3345988 RepID=UPI00363E0C1C